MHDPRINTYAALAIILLFGIGAVLSINRAIERIDWKYIEMERIVSGQD